MKQLRILSLLILLLAVWMTATAWGETVPPNNTDADIPPAVTAEAPLPDLSLVTNGEPNFTIIRGESADQTTIDAGALPNIATDWIENGETHDPNTLEILVGQTNYPESAQGDPAEISHARP